MSNFYVEKDMYNIDKRNCEDCARYIENPKFDDKKILSAKAYCKVPERIAGGLLGNVEGGETLNVIFAKGLFNCNFGRKWFIPK